MLNGAPSRFFAIATRAPASMVSRVHPAVNQACTRIAAPHHCGGRKSGSCPAISAISLAILMASEIG
jgi:hypothetical protein